MKKILSIVLTMVMLLSLVTPSTITVSAATLKKPKIISVTAKSNADLKIKWKKCKDANGYIIYRKSENTDYYKLAVVKKSSTTSYTDIRAQYGTKYTYRVRAYKVKNGKKTYSDKSKPITVYTKPLSTIFTTAKVSGKKNIKLKWSTLSNVDGYAIYRKVGNDYKRIATIKSSHTETYTVKGLNVKKNYTFAIRSFYKKDGKTTYSAKSTIKFSNKKQVYPVIELNKKVKYHGFDVVFFTGDDYEYKDKYTLEDFDLADNSDWATCYITEYYDVKTKRPIYAFASQNETFLDNGKGLQDILNNIGKKRVPAKVKNNYLEITLNKKVKYYGYDVIFYQTDGSDNPDERVERLLKKYNLYGAKDGSDVDWGYTQYYDKKTEKPIMYCTNYYISHKKPFYVINEKDLAYYIHRAGEKSVPVKVKK